MADGESGHNPEPVDLANDGAQSPDGPAYEGAPLDGGATLDGEQIRGKVATGVVLIAGRGILVKAIGIFVQLFFARLLAPAAFGEVAFGIAVWSFAVILADAGMGVGFIRRTEPPTREEMRALVGLQLTIGIVVSATTTAIALSLGHAGWVTGVIVAPLPILAFRVPAFIRCEREMNYIPMALSEIVDVLVFSAWALLFAALGFRVGALATAYFVRVIASVGTFIWLSHGPLVGPSLRFSLMKPMMAFGLQFLGVDLFGTLRDLGVNAIALGVGSLVILGQWSVTQRILQAPLIVISSFWRVSFPAMSRFLETDEDLIPVVRRAYSQTLLATALVVVPIGAAAVPGVAAVLGADWEPAGLCLYWQCLALFIAAPPYVASVAVLYAMNRGAGVLRASIVEIIVNLITAVLFVQWWGVAGLGFAGVIAALVHAGQLTFQTGGALAERSGHSRTVVLRHLLWVPAKVFVWGTVVCSVVTLIVLPMARTIEVAVAAGIGAFLAFVLGICVLAPDEFRAMWRLLQRLKPGKAQAVTAATSP